MTFHEKEFHNEENCLNCGYPLIGKFCGNCGQKANFHKDSFWHMAAHFAGDYFHYDSKFWTTIKTLFTKPGLATLEFINGKRAKYLNPIQLYIFVSTIFFLVFFTTIVNDETTQSKEKDKKEKTSSNQKSDSTSAKDSSDIENDDEIDYVDQTKQNNSSSDEKIATDTNEFSKLDIDDTVKLSEADKIKIRKALKKDKVTRFRFSSKSDNNINFTHDYDSLRQYDSAQASMQESKRDGYIKRYLTRKTYSINEKYEDANKISEVFEEKMNHNIPKVFFLLLPVFAFILKIIFTRKNMYYVDHIIFSLHFHSLIFMLLLIPQIVNYFYDSDEIFGILNFIILIGVGIYLSLSLKKVYPSPWYKIIIKQIALTIIYLISFVFALVLIFIITGLML